jgi:hypothetical protein
MPLDRIDSYFDVPAIQAEFAAIKAGLAESQTNLVGLYSVIKSFKDTSISSLAQNTDNLSQAIVGTVQATTKAKISYDELTQRIAAQVKTVNESITSVNQNTVAYDKLIQQAVRNKIANDDLAASASALKKSYDSGQSTLEQYTASLADIKTAQQSLKVSNQDVTKTLNSLEKQAQSSAGSTDQLRARLAELQSAYDKLNEVERASEGGQGLLKTIQTTDQAVKSLEGTTGRFKSNVGNYSEAFGEGFAVLKEQLAGVNKQLSEIETRGKTAVNNLGGGNPIGFDSSRHKGPTDSFGSTGSTSSILNEDSVAYQKLTLEQKILEGSLSRQQIGFKTFNQEARNVKLTLDALALAGLQNTEGFEKLNASYTSAEQKVKDLHKEQAILTSDAPALTALTGIARGLGGVYAFGAGAAGIFADGNEKLEKELNKLVAIMTFLQGLEEAVTALKDRNAIATALQTEGTKALNVVRKIEAAIFGTTTITTEENTVAKEANAAASVLNTEALAENAAGAEVQAAAVEGVTIAEGAATVATISFRTALISTGIGAIIIGLIYGITKLVGAISDWVGEDERAEKAQAALAESNSKLLATFKELKEVYEIVGKERIEQLMRESQLTKDAGKNQFLQLADEQKIADKRVENAKKFVEQYSISEKTVSDLNEKRKFDLQTLQGFQESLSNAQQKLRKDNSSANKKEVESLEKLTEQSEKDAKNSTTKYQIAADGYKESLESQNDADGVRLRTAKAAADELAKLTTDAAQRRYDTEKNAADRILNLPTSTESQKLAAIKSGYEAEDMLAQSRIKDIIKQIKAETITRKDGEDQISNISTALRMKQIKAQDDDIAIKREYYERDRDAALAASKAKLEDQIKLAQDLQQGKNQNNPNSLQPAEPVGLDQRLKGLSDEYAARKEMLNEELKVELDKEGLTAEEKTAIYTKYTSNITQLNRDFQKTYLELEEEARQKSLQDWNKYYTRRKEQITENQNQELISLNTSSERGKKYTRDKQKIDDNANIAQAQADAQNAEVQRNATREGTQDRIDADKRLTDSALKLSETIRQKKQDGIDATREQAEQGMQEVQLVGDALISLSSIAYNVQKQHLADLEIMEQRSYDRQAKNIQDSTASQEQQAVRMKILDDQRANQKLLNDRKQRQLDIQKAEFDKAKAIMDIILNTAASVTKALDVPVLAAAIAIAGAAELALAIATPIPKYRAGTKDHPGGPAIVGDAYEKELILEPGKEARWSSDRPTVESLMKHTKVIPRAKIEQWAMSGMFVNQQGILIQGQIDNKKELRDLRDAIVWQTQRLEGAAAKNNRKVVVVNKIDHSWGDYIQSKVFQ